MYGYQGRIIRVNLTSLKSTVEKMGESLFQEYIGGRGIGIKLLFDEVDPETDPLGPGNKVIIATGPLTGSGVSSACRYCVVTKSPLNNCCASSNSGGYWGPELKFAGYDAIILEGKAEMPMYLNILDDKIELLDAGDLWGKLSLETTTILQKRHVGCRVLNIGPAGENLSNMAAVMNDRDRAAGRSGVGAVLGAKKLKAICVKATARQIAVADRAELKALYKKNIPKIKKMSKDKTVFGTVAMLTTMNIHGTLPVRNWQEGVFDRYEDVSAETMREKFLVRIEACHRCPIACGRVTRSKNLTAGGPEYESIWSLGPDCDVSDYNHIIDANHLCNEYGLDTISTGSTIAAAMELYEKAYIRDEELGGLSLRWGDGESVVEWVKRIGNREGFGDKMADGSYDLCASYGVPEYSMSVKKLEMPAYDPRGLQGQGLTYATNNRGGCHVRGHVAPREVLGQKMAGIPRTSVEQKELWVIQAQNGSALNDSLGTCAFGCFGLNADDIKDLFNCVCGKKETTESLALSGERIFNLERLWNLSAGLTKEDDGLPKRLLEEPVTKGPAKGEVNRLYDMLPKYYRARGWDENGIPTREKLVELGLGNSSFDESV